MLKSKLFLYRQHIVCLSILSLVGLLSVTWFRESSFLGGMDFLFPQDRWNALYRTFFTWDLSSLGFPNPRIITGPFPYELYLLFSQVVGLSLSISEKIWIYFQYTVAGWSMYFLTVTLVKGKYRAFTGTVSALFYMLNPYIAIGIPTFTYLWLNYSLLPLKLGLFIKGITEHRDLKYAFIVSVIWVLTTNTRYSNPAMVIFDWLPLFLYLIFYLVTSKNKREMVRSVSFSVKLIGVWVALNLYWLIPIVSSLGYVAGMSVEVYSALGTNLLSRFTLNSAPLSEAMRLFGLWSIHSGYNGNPYNYWASSFDSPFFVMLSLLLLAVIFLPLLLKKKNAYVLFFSVMVLIAWVGISGALPPLASLKIWLVEHVPLLISVVENPYQFFGSYIVLGYSFLLGVGVTLVYCRLSKFKSKFRIIPRVTPKIITGLLIFLFVGVYAFPMWNGDLIYPGNNVIGSGRYTIPAYYYEAGSWLKSQDGDFRIFSLPYNVGPYAAYSWAPSGFNGPDPTEQILGKSVVSGPSDGNIGGYIATSLINNESNVANELSLLNVKYVLVHRDTNFVYTQNNSGWISASVEQYQTILTSQNGFVLEKSFGQLDFYLNERYEPTYIYAPDNTILASGNLTQLLDVTEKLSLDAGATLVISSDQLSSSQLDTIGNVLENSSRLSAILSVTYDVINPTRIIVHVNSSAPFFLVFGSSYDRYWTAEIGEKTVQLHFEGNGYANVWFIDEVGSFDVVIDYSFQSLFFYSIVISLSALIICVAYFGRRKLKAFYNGKLRQKCFP